MHLILHAPPPRPSAGITGMYPMSHLYIELHVLQANTPPQPKVPKALCILVFAKSSSSE